MEVLDTPAGMTAWSRRRAARGERIALVPTMGALHEGHRALIRDARSRADVVVVSIFVNPLQFDRPDDFSAYPRPIDDDIETCRADLVDAVYAPTAAAMYPAGFDTAVEVGAVATPLEGVARPGHFRGVTTVVSKLFHAVRPDVAVFGEKDHQQLAVLRRMVLDLDMSIEMVGHPTVREHDGLALSSRNRRLSTDQRAAASCVPRALHAVVAAAAAGEARCDLLVRCGRDVLATEPSARCEYLDVVDAATLERLDHLEAGRPAVATAAVWFGDVRLIDNVPIAPWVSSSRPPR